MQPDAPVSDWLVKDLVSYTGGLSNVSKMPCYSYNLPARECKTGAKLVKASTPERPTVCGGCYALKGNYAKYAKTIEPAMYRRFEAINKPLWAEAMAALINRKEKSGYFRWHDSGDLQSVDHLANIARVCELTPTIQHWLPTREYRTVSEFVAGGGLIPSNLNIRMSAHIIGGAVPTFPRLPVTVSSVSRDDGPEGSHRCPAPQQDNECGSCRACWDSSVKLVDYHYH